MSSGLAFSVFKKNIHELSTDDISNYFSIERQESDVLEFKSYVDDNRSPNLSKTARDKEKLNEIIRTICGFLNSDGGILIWGSPSGKSIDGAEKTFKGRITPVDYKIEQEQFINKIASEISPTPLRILFQPIHLGDNKFCYVFEVDKSEFRPHQFKGTYYMRMDGSTRTAPHHYVEALIKRISYPKIEGYLTFGEMVEHREYRSMLTQVTIHSTSKLINEKNVKYRLLCNGGRLVAASIQGMPDINTNTDFTKKATEVLHYNMPYYEHLIFISPRDYNFRTKELLFFLNVWGESSPAIASSYRFQIALRNDMRIECSLVSKEENFYLMDRKNEEPLSEKERIDKSNKELFETINSRRNELEIYQILHNFRKS